MIATAPDETAITIRPHAGPQEQFLASAADIAIYGGAAGGGKTYALLLEPLRHIHNPEFACLIFRQTYPQIASPGGLLDESAKIYPAIGALLNETAMRWRFPSGADIRFSHLQYEKDKYAWQGSQIALIGFDELTHFSQSQFFYLLSRNRSTCGVRPYVRATCNPDARSWVADFIAWWIDQETGYPIPERSGHIRWFVRDGDDLVWDDSQEALQRRFPQLEAKSVAFIPAKLEDNPTLMSEDPAYLANLMALPRVERERLLGGNWKVTEDTIIPLGLLRYYTSTPDGQLQAIIAGQRYTFRTSDCRRFATIDTAGTSREKADEARGKPASWSALAVWDYYPQADLLLLRHIWRDRVGWNALKTRVPEVLRTWDVRRVYLENAHYGPSLRDELVGFNVQLIGPVIPRMRDSHRGAKLERAVASGLLSRIEDGRMMLPDEGSEWRRKYISELTTWTGLPDETADQIDVSSYAAYVCKRQSQTWGGTFGIGGLNRKGIT